MSQLQALRAAATLHDVANLLQFNPSGLAYVIYKNPKRYTSFTIPKKGGGSRLIKAPTPELKLLQNNLSKLLQGCVQEINEKRNFPDQLAHGFKPKRSIITNAGRHQKRRFVFNLDLEDFFPSINFGRVRGFFIKDANFMLAPAVATVLAQIACDDKALPQGSPCSPVISNLVGHILDIHLSKLARVEGCVYSRYADDITFSTNKPAFPIAIARQTAVSAHQWEAGAEVQKIIKRAGFVINANKFRMQYRDSRQSVTGLTVNRKVNIKGEYRRTARAMAQRLFMTGEFEYEGMVFGSGGVWSVGKVKGSIEQLHGMLGHVEFVDRHNAQEESKFDSGSKEAKKEAKLRLYSKQSLYRRFLLFKEFYAAARPVIVCEGKTDNTYLRYALKGLAGKYPVFAALDASGKAEFKVRILRTLDSCVGRVLDLCQGYSSLNRLIDRYVAELKVKAPSPKHPVIILADNDAGGAKVLSTVKGVVKHSVANTEPFIHVAGNLYLVLTPLASGASKSEIEDCFDDNFIANLVLGGKKFNSDEKADSALYFSKSILAEHIRQNAGKIDFSGFSGILDRFMLVINDYEARTAQMTATAKAAAAPY